VGMARTSSYRRRRCGLGGPRWRHCLGMAAAAEVIPTHFNLTGKADGWGSRWLIVLLPFVGNALFGALVGLARVPQSYNYPWRVTPENAARQYLLARRLMLAFSILLPVVFLRLLLGVIAVASGRAMGLGSWSLIENLAPVTLLLGLYLIMAWHRR